MSLLAAIGCDETSSEEGEAPTGAACDPALTYDDDIAPLMERYCTSCHGSDVALSDRHGAPGDHNFDTEDGVLEMAAHIDLRAGSGPDATNRSMPPKGPRPSDDERATLSAFLACETGGGSGESEHAH